MRVFLAADSVMSLFADGIAFERPCALPRLEDLRLIASGNADAVILDFELDGAVITVQLHAEEFFVSRIFQRVVNQVDNRAGNRFSIYAHYWQVCVDALLKGKTLLLDLITIR